MIGFELKLNGEKTSASIEDGVLSLIITKLTNEHEDAINLDFSGLNTKDHEHIYWLSKQLKDGDELTIKIKNIEELSTPVKMKKIHKKLEKDRKLENYYSLKKSLEAEGLI
ncbi:hypothetical protein [Marinifilum caeruleilacunae]|uniref:STAS domain-containing protein n=1 Tax=Marinifilum caeruleilacunae TaxID=2499076 RepID=A0ABX1X0G3_9BACT|nr:hypothetical protein [Marinifilum caeruleilacunae]NOU61701.1 hypothetical protein [Marinifilum caeruleilacunae]